MIPKSCVCLLSANSYCEIWRFSNSIFRRVAVAEVSDHTLIIHCEFSSNRGPNLARELREIDRALNIEKGLIDTVTFKNLFVLKGGYRQFHYECSSYLQCVFVSLVLTYCIYCHACGYHHIAYAGNAEVRKLALWCERCELSFRWKSHQKWHWKDIVYLVLFVIKCSVPTYRDVNQNNVVKKQMVSQCPYSDDDWMSCVLAILSYYTVWRLDSIRFGSPIPKSF